MPSSRAALQRGGAGSAGLRRGAHRCLPLPAAGAVGPGRSGSNLQNVEVIRESAREPSDLEPIKGSYKADYDGIFIFIFDNSFSWFTDKSLSYTIHLLQPAFALADSSRAVQSRRLLKTILEESRQAKERLIQAKERSSSLNLEITAIQARMIALQQELSNKKAIVDAAEKELQECAERIAINEAKKAGLCIRCLDKKSLSNVLSFLGKQAETRRVSKYWKALVDEL